ncbi:MAG: TonB-dependent receptor plug domain-containing protein, partial [Burkholderiales bacterium]|nr:TonB-dependent receptor plug domain-containing protein [Phycisphaerae bacterium]
MARHWKRQAVRITGAFIIASSAAAAEHANTNNLPADGTDDFVSMSLEDLMNVEVQSPGGLTSTDPRRRPISITELDVRDIQQSGARDLNRLLEIYVPNLQIIHHHSHQDHVGFRGIISDRDDKYLFQVNGLTMNNRMLVGADNERQIPLLGDLRSVSVVRGPASATHGSGAVAGVIDVETYSGLTFQGADVKVRQGLVDQYTATELRYGRRFSETSGIFLYYGVAGVEGADADYYIGKSYPATNGLPANVAGEPYGGPMANIGEAGFDAIQQKAHLSYVNGPWEFWARYTQDGSEMRPIRQIYASVKPADVSVEDWTRGREGQNQQFTAAVSFKKEISSTLKLELLQSYDIFAYTDSRSGIAVGQAVRHASENELFTRAIAVWTPNDAHS